MGETRQDARLADSGNLLTGLARGMTGILKVSFIILAFVCLSLFPYYILHSSMYQLAWRKFIKYFYNSLF